jgi:hypothetical protein
MSNLNFGVAYKKSPKQASKPKDNNLIRTYGNYLGDKGKDKDKGMDADKDKDKGVDSDKGGSKKISIHRKPKRSRDNMKISRSRDKGRSKKPFNPSMDINEIEKQAQLFSRKQGVAKAQVAQAQVAQVAQVAQAQVAQVAQPKKVSKPKKAQRSHKRQTKRHKTKGRRIKIRKKDPKAEDLKEIEQKISSIRNKKPRDIREALLKDGIKVSGKSNRLLKDIYFYSKVCNINIRHEI